MTRPCEASPPSSWEPPCWSASARCSSSGARVPRPPSRRPRGRCSRPAPPSVALRSIGTFDQPVYLTSPPGDSSRLFVVEKTGRIRIVKNGSVLATPFLDISGLVSHGGEQGLLSMAFDPRFAANRRFYVDYTDVNGDTRVVALSGLESGSGRRRPGSAKVLLRVAQPYANHNGGQLQFGAGGPPLRRHGRRGQRRRPAASRPGPAQPPGQAAPPRRERLAGQGRHLRQGTAQSVAVLLRPQDRRALDRRRRARTPGRRSTT